jgi:hypothetical protein
VRGDYLAERKHSLLISKEVKEQRIKELAQGDAVPFLYDFVVHVWNETEDGLISKTRQIEAAFDQMEDAQCWTSNISSAASTKNIWFQTWSQYVEQLYTDRFEEWIAEDASRLDTVARHAMAALEYKAARLPLSATFLEAWTRLRDATSEDERQAFIHRPKPEEVSRFLKSPETERPQRRLRVLQARGLPDARHAPANDAGRSVSRARPRRNQPHRNLARPWNEQRLVCGHSTLSITGRIAHFDLTYIPESNKPLQELAAFLIANHGRQHIITLPRGKTKEGHLRGGCANPGRPRR